MFRIPHLFALILIAGQALWGPCGYAQTTTYYHQQLDNRNGLSNSAINALYIDRDDLLWIGTWDGLNRYDGNDFYTFNYGNPHHSGKIGNNVIQTIAASDSGALWLTTIEGISKYNRQTGTFSNYGYQFSRNSKLGEQDFKIAVNKAGELYSWTYRTGGAKYLEAVDSFSHYPFEMGTSAVVKMLFDTGDHLWVLHQDGILQQLKNTAHGFSPVLKFQLPVAIIDFFHVKEKIYVATTDGALYALTLQPGTHHNEAAYTKKAQLSSPACGMVSYKNHYILADQQKGIVVLDQEFRPASFLSDQVRALQDMRITSFAVGNDQMLWCGTDGNGIIKIYPHNKTFGTVFTAQNNQLANKSVRAFCENNGDLWVATKGSGIITYKDYLHAGEKATVQYINTASGLENNDVYALKAGKDAIIYIGTDGQGICIYDQINKRIVPWNAMQHLGKKVNFASVYAILQTADSSVWLGTSGYGLIQLRVKRNPWGGFTVTLLNQFTYKTDGSGPANDIIYALSEDKEGNLWVACRYGGLSVMHMQTKAFRSIKASQEEGSLSHNDLLALYSDSQNRLWIGTSYGLNQISAENRNAVAPQFQKYTTDNGLPNNTIHAITEDKKGMIWVSTNKGLARIDPRTNSIAHYQQADGLQSNEFSDGGVWRNAQGYLFFGGTYGFNYFLPDHIGNNTAKPNLLISGFQIGGIPMNENLYTVLAPEEDNIVSPDVPTPPRQIPAYTIDRAKGFFELNVKAINYQNAEKSEFTYKLEGLDNNAHYAGNTGKIFYNNLLPGKYSLKIRWSNGEGIWTNDHIICTIHVRQFWWLSWPAILAYIIIIAALVYTITRYLKHKRSIKYKLEIAQALRQKELELHEKQLGFYTNITHELQTPLTLIMGSTERFMEHDMVTSPRKNYFLSLMHQQAAHLTYLVQQILDFRKAEAGHLQKNYKLTDITHLLQQLSELFIPLSEKQNRAFTRHIPSKMTGMVDVDKLEKVMFNLLTNAFKHANGQAPVELNVQLAAGAGDNNGAEPAGLLSITVSNGGQDIPGDQLEQLFDNYYVAAEGKQKLGAGIGLAFTKQLVLLMEGNITAHIKDNIIYFTVTLPVAGMQHPEDKQHSSSAASMVAFEKVMLTQEAPATTAHATSTTNYIFKSITSNQLDNSMISSLETNKMALLESIEKKDKETILVVDDEAAIRYLIRDIFKKDFILYEAASGDEALEMLKNISPDLIISDILMPGINGLEFCNKIKNSASTCHIPFVLLSGRNEPEHQNEGYGSGADAYLPKPFHNNHLKIRVTKLLEYRKLLIHLFKKEGLIDYTIEADLVDVDKKFLSSLTDIIEENLDDVDFNAAALEKAMNMSRMQLYRKLKTLTQMTPAEFIKHIRLKHAANLLSSTQLTVSQIFYRTGFNNQSYFYREFKKHYQYSPSEYRTR